MQVTKGTWYMRKQCVPGSLFSSVAQEPGNEASPETNPSGAAINQMVQNHLLNTVRSVRENCRVIACLHSVRGNT